MRGQTVYGISTKIKTRMKGFNLSIKGLSPIAYEILVIIHHSSDSVIDLPGSDMVEAYRNFYSQSDSLKKI